MVSSVNSTGSAMELLQEKRAQILEKLQNGEAEAAIVTGGNAFTETVWNKMLENVDDYLEQVKEDQKVRFAKMDAEKEEKELLLEQQDEKEREDALREKVQSWRALQEADAVQAESIKEALVARSGAEETVNSISDSATVVSEERQADMVNTEQKQMDVVTAEQIAELFRDNV